MHLCRRQKRRDLLAQAIGWCHEAPLLGWLANLLVQNAISSMAGGPPFGGIVERLMGTIGPY